MDGNYSEIAYNYSDYKRTSLGSMLLNFTDGIQSSPPNAYNLALTRYIVQRLLVPIITSLGFVGNVISICVFSQRSMKSSTNCYLTALAVFDTLYLVFSFTLSLRHYDGMMNSHAYLHWFPWGRVFTDICSNVSVSLTVTFTMERYIGVCHPMKGRVLCTIQRAKLITFLVICVTTGCTAPEFFEWEIVTMVDNVSDTSYPVIEDSQLAQSFSYQVGYHWFIVCFFTILPLVLLCVFNGILIKSVFQATRIRHRMAYMSVNKEPGRRQGEQHKITLMLISVALVFLICQFPVAILLLYRSYIQGEDISMSPEQRNNLRIGGNVVNLLILINSSINCVLYSVMSTRFRRVFFQLFCRHIPLLRSHFRTDLSALQTASARTQASSFHYSCKRGTNISAFNNGYMRRGTMRNSYLTPRNNPCFNNQRLGNGDGHAISPILLVKIASQDDVNRRQTPRNNDVIHGESLTPQTSLSNSTSDGSNPNCHTDQPVWKYSPTIDNEVDTGANVITMAVSHTYGTSNNLAKRNRNDTSL